LLYGYLYVADKEEGLVIIGDPNLRSKSPGIGTLLDGNPANNFLKRAVTFNPKGVLTGARRIAIAGTFAYVLTDKALVVVDLENPDAPKLVQMFPAERQLNDVNDVKIGMVAASAFAFVADGKNGLRVLQILSPWDDPARFSGFSPRPTPKLIGTAHTH